MILAFSLQEKLINQEKLISQEKSIKTIVQCEHINKNWKQWLIKQSESDDDEAMYENVEIEHEKHLKILNLSNENSYLSIDSMFYHTNLSH